MQKLLGSYNKVLVGVGVGKIIRYVFVERCTFSSKHRRTLLQGDNDLYGLIHGVNSLYGLSQYLFSVGVDLKRSKITVVYTLRIKTML